MANTKKYRNTLLGLSALAITVSFCFKNDNPDKVVLRVGKATITEYELEKNLDVFLSDFTRQNGRVSSKIDTQNWIDEFIDRAYFLADAYDKGYDTLDDVLKWVRSMEHYVVSKKGGLLDEKLDMTSMSQEEIQAALIKNSRRVYISYLKFRDYNSALDFLNGHFNIKDSRQFSEAFKKESAPLMTVGEDKIEWPFMRRGEREEFVLGMVKDQISPILILSDGVYIVRADSVENVEIARQPDSLKKRIVQTLQLRKKQNRQTEYFNEIKRQARINIDSAMLSRFTGYVKNRPAGEFRENEFAPVLSHTLFTYHDADTQQRISVARFFEYYNTLPIRKVVRDVEGLVFYIETMVYDALAFQKAEQMGITRELKFLLDRENYKKNVMLAAYENRELKKEIQVAHDELLKKYEEDKNDFTEATDVTVSAYLFDNRTDATLAAMGIKGKRNDWQYLKHEALHHHSTINYKDNFFTDSIRAAVFSAGDREVLMPFYFNGKFIVINKESATGQRIKTLTEVERELIKRIGNGKLKEKKQVYLKRLKAVYTLQNTIECRKYLGGSKIM